jgi:hypothetical protein
MFKPKLNPTKYNEVRGGQVLVAVTILLILALSVGVAASSRMLKNIKVFSRSDDSAKALAAAEAAVERILLKDDDTIDEYITNGTCGSDCYISFADSSEATVALSYLANTEEPFEVSLSISDVSAVDLEGYPSGSIVDVCWDEDTSVVGLYVYLDSEYKAEPYAYNPTGFDFGNGLLVASAGHGYASCFQVDTEGTPQLLRLRAEHLDTTATVFPASGQTMPGQGFLIESVGKAGDTVKKVRVAKRNSVLPAIFDYAIYQASETESLSNLIQ